MTTMGESDTEFRFRENSESDGLSNLLLTITSRSPDSKGVQNYILFLEKELKKRDNPRRTSYEDLYEIFKQYKLP